MITTGGEFSTRSIGISADGSNIHILQNVIGSISTNGVTSLDAASLWGIDASGNVTISHNLVGSTTTANSLNAATNSSSNSGQSGIGIRATAYGTYALTIQGNTVANFNNNYVGTYWSGGIQGINASGKANISENVVRNLTSTSQVRDSVLGIIFYGEGVISKNSVYGLTNTSTSTAYSAAFDSTGSSNARSIQNNIFFNSRSNNSSATGKHYAFRYGSTSQLISNNNLYFVNGSGGVLGYSGSDHFSLIAWQAATGVDLASVEAGPLFANPNGSVTTIDLRIQAGSPANNAGTSIPGITTDFEGDLRSTTAPDIGADERDMTPPRVVGVYAAGSTWSAGMVDAVDGGGIGAGNGLGYEWTAGLTLPNVSSLNVGVPASAGGSSRRCTSYSSFGRLKAVHQLGL